MSDVLCDVLEEARRLGFLGPGPVSDHIAHARAFLGAIAPTGGVVHAVDLGSGGGLPGLVLAGELHESSWVLLDANQRRTAFLTWAVDQLGVAPRVRVEVARAEDAGRDPGLRQRADLVVARSFGAPPVTAECAAPLLVPGGELVVSEPPISEETPSRWPAAGLAELGMVVEATVDGPPRFVRIRQEAACAERYPRRTGVPAKRPLW